MTKGFFVPRGDGLARLTPVPARVRLAIGGALLGLPLLSATACQSAPATVEPEPHFMGDPQAPLTVVEWGDFQ